MFINPAINHEACFNIISDTEINVDVLHRIFRKYIEYVSKYPQLLSS